MWNRKRWLIALVLFALVVGAGFWIALALREPEHGVTPEVVARIREGMTAEEVEEIIGMPPGGYRPDKLSWPGRVKHTPPTMIGSNIKKVAVHETMFWLLDGCSIEVQLGESGQVIDVQARFYTRWQRVEMQFWQLLRF